MKPMLANIKNIISTDDQIAVLLGAVGLWAFFIAYAEYPFSEGVFPMIASGIMIVSASIWLLRGYLPELIHSSLIEYEEGAKIEEEEVGADPVESGSEYGDSRLYPLILATIGYVILAYLIGFLWATPFFVLVYAVMNKLDRRSTAVVVAVSFAVVFGFAFFTPVHLDQGIVWGYRI
ncbi:tripartite tricarboxylate transporter TctB family protein [Natronorarus salvus]|uniref:tripartite tricarboxylate transporter TctB family protein n=1 Tax=Natronorarus salvus TaxID=3117733 RepID=UPI002F26157C